MIDDDVDSSPELMDLLRMCMLSVGLAVPPERVLGDFRAGLERLRQQGSVSLRSMARVRAQLDRRPGDEHEDEDWVRGYTAGYTAAWAGAVLRVLEVRDIEVSKEIFRPLSLCPDADALTRYLDRAVTASTPEELFTPDLMSGT
ncbi:hypothetical protein [Streptomyces sp. NK08204]|uniref:hypothetical protein n=1 Tax=Streptomyces sp. NK08204 TaxID=2873260 RepID=UPI001CED041A|nr:hypothetical protein [Streptomyces sp. NK08204]